MPIGTSNQASFRLGRLGIWLPLVQTGIAIALTVHNVLRPADWMEFNQKKLDQQICDDLNAPASAVRFLMVSLLKALLDDGHPWLGLFIWTVVYFMLIWLLWYAVCVELGGRGSSVLAQKSGMRKTADALGVVFGVAVFALGIYTHRYFHPSLYLDLILVPHLVWGALIVWFYGRDLRRALSGARGVVVAEFD